MPTILHSSFLRMLSSHRPSCLPHPSRPSHPSQRGRGAVSVVGALLAGALLAGTVTAAPIAEAQPRTTATIVAAAPASARPASRADTSWHVLVEQGGKVQALDRKPVLRLAPFTLLFTGPASYAYAVVAARNASALPASPDFATMKALVHPDRLAPDRSDRTDHALTINEDASLASRTPIAHVWAEDAARATHAFLRFDVGPDGRAIAIRPVSNLCRPSFRVDRPDCRDLSEIAARQAWVPKRPRRPASNARSPEDFAILVAAIPAGRLTRFETPRVYEIRFAPSP